MAKMYPSTITPTTKSDAERQLFTEFSEQLSDEYHVFHSVRWQLPGSMGREDGETDFIIAHPRDGILIVEVKGGSISYDGTSGIWMSGDNPVTDPLEQALRSKYSLLDLKKSDHWLRREWINIGYAVALPDVTIEGDLLPELPRSIVMDAGDLLEIPSWLNQAFAYWKGESPDQSPPDHRYVRMLTKLLAPSWDLRPRLSQQFAQEGRKIDALTREQLYILDVISKERRAAIAGCAGSGKTILAMEKAMRLAESGFEVAFVCFNRNLADHINATIGLLPKIDVSTFHALCERLSRNAGLRTHENSGDDYFSKVLPELALQAIDRLGPRYDAIVVDEGQDFSVDWWLILDGLLRAGERDVFYIFFDDNQLLYQQHINLPMEVAEFSLTKNLRNTQTIHEFSKQFYQSDHPIAAEGPLGRAIEFVPYSDDQMLHSKIRKILHRLIIEQDILAEDLVLLTPRSRSRSVLWELAPFGNFNLIPEPPGGGAEILCTTVHSFKGLERPVVIISELDESTTQDLHTLLYVGSTRACNHLIVMGSPDLIGEDGIRLRQ